MCGRFAAIVRVVAASASAARCASFASSEALLRQNRRSSESVGLMMFSCRLHGSLRNGAVIPRYRSTLPLPDLPLAQQSVGPSPRPCGEWTGRCSSELRQMIILLEVLGRVRLQLGAGRGLQAHSLGPGRMYGRATGRVALDAAADGKPDRPLQPMRTHRTCEGGSPCFFPPAQRHKLLSADLMSPPAISQALARGLSRCSASEPSPLESTHASFCGATAPS